MRNLAFQNVISYVANCFIEVVTAMAFTIGCYMAEAKIKKKEQTRVVVDTFEFYLTATLCFLGSDVGFFLGTSTSRSPSFTVDSAFSGTTSSGNTIRL